MSVADLHPLCWICLNYRRNVILQTKGVFEIVSSYFDVLIKWHLVGVCMDGAPEMLGSRSRFVARIKQRSPNTAGTHCIIRCGALASRT